MSAITGRRRDSVWDYFKEVTGNFKSKRAICKRCNEEMSALVVRMKDHILTKCSGVLAESSSSIMSMCEKNTDDEEEHDLVLDLPSTSHVFTSLTSAMISTNTIQPVSCNPGKRKSSTKQFIDNFVIKTSEEDKKKLDMQVARFIFGTNSSFLCVQHPEFCKLINMLRPGYTPPTRQHIAGTLLDNVYNGLKADTMVKLNGKTVCLALDGWSNIHNDSIICICVTDISESDGIVYLIDTIDTKDHSHSWDYLLNLAITSIQKCTNFGCIVGSLVTDNAANMFKMRSNLAMQDDFLFHDIITHGCSAHLIMNLLAKDIEEEGVKNYVKKIIKYFKYSHFFSAKFKIARGKALILPQDVRWNTLADSIESYIDNWSILHQICTNNRSAVDNTILQLVEDVSMKNKAQQYLIKLKKIASSLDRLQSNNCTLSEATSIWINLKEYFETLHDQFIIEKISERMELAITPYHILGYILDPRFRGEKLNHEQLDEALNYTNLYHPTVMAEIITFQAQGLPFSKYLFDKLIVQKVSPLIWWTSLEKQISVDMLKLVTKLFTAVASSAGIERLFSTFGLVHTKIRNRLGVEKASKLVSVFKSLNTVPMASTSE